MSLYRVGKVLVNLYFWSYTVVFFTFWLSLCALTWLLTFPFDGERRAFRSVLHVWCWLYLKLCPFWRFRIEGAKSLPKGACVLAANHQSLFDIVVLLALNRRFKWVAKKELFARPFVGWLLFFGRDVSLDRASLRDASLMLRLCNTWLDKGVSIAIFPEGHRSEDGRVAHFKRGAFQIAKEAGVPLIPLMIAGPAQSIRGYFIEPKVVAIKLELLSPTLPEAFERHSSDEIALGVEELVRNAHKKAVPSLYTQGH